MWEVDLLTVEQFDEGVQRIHQREAAIAARQGHQQSHPATHGAPGGNN